MEEKVIHDRYRTAVFMFAVAAFCALISSVFINYGKKINEHFMCIEKETLSDFGEAHSVKISEDLADIQRHLKATAEFAGASFFDPESEEFERYLVSVNGENLFPIDYIPAREWGKKAAQADLREEEREFCLELLEGRTAVSELIYSPSRDGYYFSLGDPVVREGEMIGVVKCSVNVDALMEQMMQYSTIQRAVVSCISDEHGQILYCSDEKQWLGENICDILQEREGQTEVIDNFLRAVREGLSITLSMGADSDSTFLTNIPMGIKGWNLISFSNAGMIKNISSQMLDDTIVMGISLISLTFLAGLVIYILMIESRRKIKLEQERYAALSNFSDTILFEYNHKLDLLKLTQNASHLLGIERHSICHFQKHGNDMIHPDDVVEALNALTAVRTERKADVMELRIQGKDSGWIWCECKMQPIAGNRDIVIGKLTDITGRKAREMSLLSLSSTDTLTGLMNREAFVGKVESLVEERQKGFFFMIDVDNFKWVNDTKGHEVGDGCLTKIGELLRQSFRDYDPVARIGGDEFAAFMSDTSDRENAQKKAELILSKLSQAETEVEMSVSIGIAACPDDGRTYRELYRNADHAMYLAKRKGKKRFTFKEETPE